MADYIKCEVMRMKYVSLAICGVMAFLAWLGREYYKAIHNDLVQVWDVINELKGEEDAASK